MTELISIIVPIYNVEKYLRQCLDSILAQTYSNIEVIMVDDGSQDASGAISEEYAGKYTNFTVVHKQNAGLGMARNSGLECVHGSYVMFIDSDDYIDPNLVEVLYSAVKDNNVDICKSGCRRVTDDGTIVKETRYTDEIFPGKRAATQFFPRLIGSAPDRKDSFEMSVWASLYKTNLIKEHHIRFPSEREWGSEDIFFNFEYTQYANGAVSNAFIGYNYRINYNSLSRKYKEDTFDISLKRHKALKELMVSKGYTPDDLYRLDRATFIAVRYCIKQESVFYDRGKEASQMRIARICNNEYLQQIILNYPVKRLGIRQKVFVYMVKYKMVSCLYLCAKLGLMSIAGIK